MLEILNVKPKSLPDDFVEEKSASDFISGNELIVLLGINDINMGTRFNSDAGWIGCMSEGDLIYVAKKPFLYNCSPSVINAANAINGSRIVTIKNRRYRVRLLNKNTAYNDGILAGLPANMFYAIKTNKNRLSYR